MPRDADATIPSTQDAEIDGGAPPPPHFSLIVVVALPDDVGPV